MCGILGTIPALDSLQFSKALNLLEHRGPDASDVWTHPNQSTRLGHRRLAILDLSEQGIQPMHFEHLSLVFNGEIYNFCELKEELKTKGHQFQTETDSEVILHAYLQWGKEAFLRFNGMWALAIWDEKKQELLLCRDRFGQKPLFYSQKEEQLVFASEMKAIVPFLDQLEVSKNFKWMKDHPYDYEGTEDCLIKGIKRFPPGHLAFFKKGKLNFEQYWKTLDHLPEIPQTYEKQVEVFRDLMEKACSLRMRADVPLATSLSGGLDSSITLALTASLQKKGNLRRSNFPIQSFTASFPDTLLDETAYAKIMVEHTKVKGTFLQVSPSEAISKMNRSLFLFEEIYTTSPAPMMQTYGAIRNAGVKVTLDGHGADELMCGYNDFLFQAFPDCRFNQSKIKAILETYNGLYPESGNMSRKKAIHSDYWSFLIRHQIGTKILDPIRGRSIFQEKKTNELVKRLGHFNAGLYVLFHHQIMPTLLRNYDRYGMANGLEIRMPFLDHRLVCFSLALPWTSKIGGGFTKRIMRDAFKDLLPESIKNRKVKIGYNTPFVEWLKNDWKSYFLDTIHSKDFEECALIDSISVKDKILQLMNEDKTPYKEGQDAWQAIHPYLWSKVMLDPASYKNE